MLVIPEKVDQLQVNSETYRKTYTDEGHSSPKVSMVFADKDYECAYQNSIKRAVKGAKGNIAVTQGAMRTFCWGFYGLHSALAVYYSVSFLVSDVTLQIFLAQAGLLTISTTLTSASLYLCYHVGGVFMESQGTVLLGSYGLSFLCVLLSDYAILEFFTGAELDSRVFSVVPAVLLIPEISKFILIANVSSFVISSVCLGLVFFMFQLLANDSGLAVINTIVFSIFVYVSGKKFYYTEKCARSEFIKRTNF